MVALYIFLVVAGLGLFLLVYAAVVYRECHLFCDPMAVVGVAVIIGGLTIAGIIGMVIANANTDATSIENRRICNDSGKIYTNTNQCLTEEQIRIINE